MFDDKIVPQKLLINLKKLDCPLLLNQEHYWIQNVLFSTPEHHVKLLHWILVNFNKELQVSLDENCSFKDCSLEVRIEKLVQVCTSLGLWEGLNEDIIKCTSSRLDIFCFWEFLVDIFFVKQSSQSSIESNEDLGGSYLSTHRSKKKSRPTGTFGSLYADACQSLEKLGKRSLSPSFFPTSAQLSHPEIEKALKQSGKDRQETPRIADLKKDEEDINKSLEQECDKLTFSSEGDLEYTAREGLTAGTEQCLQKLEADLLTTKFSLHQLIEQFDTFHDQIKTLLGRKQDDFSQVGVKYHLACQKFQKLNEILEKFYLIKDSHAKLQLLEKEKTMSSVMTILPGFFGEITEKRLKMLERILEN